MTAFIMIFSTVLSPILELSPIFKPEAYLDPGSGSFVIQILFGFLVGAIVVLKTYWSRIKAMFSKSHDGSPENAAAEISVNEQPNEQ